MTALTRMTKAQLIELAQRLTADNTLLTDQMNAVVADNNTLRDDAVHCAHDRDRLLAQLRERDSENFALHTQCDALRAEHQAVVAPVTPPPSRKLREPNETELRRLAIIDECHRLTKLHHTAVWYDWKYGEYRLRRNGIIQVLEAAPCN